MLFLIKMGATKIIIFSFFKDCTPSSTNAVKQPRGLIWLFCCPPSWHVSMLFKQNNDFEVIHPAISVSLLTANFSKDKLMNNLGTS